MATPTLREKAWYSYPLIKTCFAFVAGIITVRYHPNLVVAIIIYAIAGVLCLLILLSIPKNKHRYQLRFLNGCCRLSLFFLLGTAFMQQRLDEMPNPNINTTSSRVLVEIVQPLERGKKSFTALGKILAWEKENVVKHVAGEIHLFFSAKDATPKIELGNRLVIEKCIQLIPENKEKDGFDYRGYAFSKGIYFQVFLREGNYMITDSTASKGLIAGLFIVKRYIIRTLNMYIPDTRAAAIAAALLIAHKSNLDQSLMQAYSETGIIHIIAISGMHLGLIYLLIRFLLSPLKRIKYYPIIQFVTTLTIIWLFSILTGASSSIVRAAIIFSFLCLGELIQRKHNSKNALAAAAWCLLVYNPLLLWDIGFQLTFAAVIGILWFYQPIRKSFPIQNKLLRACWESTAITLAAQILTLPLLLYYFHQFPVLFVFTNFIAIPVSGVILYLEITLVLVSPLPSIASVFGKLVASLLGWLNNWVEQMAALPFATVHHIQITLPQTLAIYVLIVICAQALTFAHHAKENTVGTHFRFL